MLIYLGLTMLFCLELYGYFYPDNYEKMYNQTVVKYNVLKLQLEKNELIRNKGISLGYKCIHFYSICQIQYNKLYRMFLKPIIKCNNDVKTRVLIIITKNGNAGCNITLSNNSSINSFKLFFNEKRHMGMVLYDKNEEIGVTNVVFYERFPETLDYNVSDIKFMSIELEYNKEIYAISLKDDSHNYYIVNNCLNQNFFKYYLKNVLKIYIDEDKFDYKLSIIDHNVNIITLQSNEYIVIGEKDYQIVSLRNNDQEQTVEQTVEQTIEQTDYNSDKSDDFIKIDSDNLA